MKTAGYILSIVGCIAFIGAASAGHSVFGPLFWLAVGAVLIYYGKQKEDDKESKEDKDKVDQPQTKTNTSEADMENKTSVAINDKPVSFWDKYVTYYPEKATQISSLLCVDFSLLTDKDAQEKINTIDRLCSQYQCDVSQLKERCLKDMEQFPLSFIDKMIEMTEKEMGKEALNYNIAKENTACAFLIFCMKERKTFLEKNNVYNITTKDDINNDVLSPEELFKNRYSEILIRKIGNNANVPLFCEGYDSPIAHELMDVMYAFLKDKTEKEKANKLGYGKRYIFIITEETEKVVKRYCHAALQECIEYYKFPNKEVVTSFRCPHCGSWKVWNEDYGFECGECGCTWQAPLGYNLYLDYDNNN